MNSKTGWLLGGLGAGLTWIALSSARLSNFAKEFEIKATGRIHQFALSGMIIAIDITFQNPTDATLRVKHPTLKLYDQNPEPQYDKKTGKLLPLPTPQATSDIEAKEYTILPNTQTKLNTIFLPISTLSMAKELTTLLFGGRNITLYVRATTSINGIAIPPQYRSFPINLYDKRK